MKKLKFVCVTGKMASLNSTKPAIPSVIIAMQSF